MHTKFQFLLKVMERSVHSARACFTENLVPVLSPGEAGVLDAWYQLLTREMDMEVGMMMMMLM